MTGVAYHCSHGMTRGRPEESGSNEEKVVHLRHGWFFWIGGACFQVGSLVAGSYGVASSSTSGPTVSGTVNANQGAPGTAAWPVSGNVGIAVSLPAGTNDIGTVHVANPKLITGTVDCEFSDTSPECEGAAGLSAGTVVKHRECLLPRFAGSKGEGRIRRRTRGAERTRGGV